MKIDIAAIKLIIKKIRENNRVKGFSNYYFQPLDCDCFDVIETEKTCLFSFNNNGIYRCYFYSADIDDLKDCVRKLSLEACISIISNNGEDFDEIMNACGMIRYAVWDRYSNNNLKSFIGTEKFNELTMRSGNDKIDFAQLHDAENLQDIILRTFDKKAGMLPVLNRINESILNNEILVYKKDNRIASFLYQKADGKKMYINLVYNEAGNPSEHVHAIMTSVIKNNVSKGCEYLYAWISRSNIRSIKFHQKYLMVPDGVSNLIYVKKEKYNGKNLQDIVGY